MCLSRARHRRDRQRARPAPSAARLIPVLATQPPGRMSSGPTSAMAPGMMRSPPVSFGRRSAQICPATMARIMASTRSSCCHTKSLLPRPHCRIYYLMATHGLEWCCTTKPGPEASGPLSKVGSEHLQDSVGKTEFEDSAGYRWPRPRALASHFQLPPHLLGLIDRQFPNRLRVASRTPSLRSSPLPGWTECFSDLVEFALWQSSAGTAPLFLPTTLQSSAWSFPCNTQQSLH